jgi:hypothetical protein
MSALLWRELTDFLSMAALLTPIFWDYRVNIIFAGFIALPLPT